VPKYSFECQDCGNLRFERSLKMGDHPTHECPSCGEESPRVISAFGFSFKSGGSAPANSGVHDLDYPSADKLVGRSAHDRWSTYVERDQVKKKVRKGGSAPELMRADGEGYVEYTSMPKTLKKERESLVDLAVAIGARRKNQ
jgi:putative FmdB family regulatory protein